MNGIERANFVFGGNAHSWYEFERNKVIRYFKIHGRELEFTMDGEVVSSLEGLQTYLKNFSTFEDVGEVKTARFACISAGIQIPADDTARRIAAEGILHEADAGKWSLILDPGFKLLPVFKDIGGISLRETIDSQQLKQEIGWHPF